MAAEIITELGSIRMNDDNDVQEVFHNGNIIED